MTVGARESNHGLLKFLVQCLQPVSATHSWSECCFKENNWASSILMTELSKLQYECSTVKCSGLLKMHKLEVVVYGRVTK